MSGLSFIEQHIVDCIRAAIVESRGDERHASRLRAQGRLRLVCMSDDELWELAHRTCCLPRRSAQEAYTDITRTVAEYRATADEWLWQVFGGRSSGPSK